MRRYLRLGKYLITLCVAVLSFSAALESKADTLLIQNAMVLDMIGDAPIRNASVLINDDSIERIWSDNERPSSIPPDTEVIDASGKVLLPAFIDSHVHYNWYMGELFLAHGITTVNDLSNRIYWQAATKKGLNTGRLRGPRYLFCARIGGELVSDPAALAQMRLFATASRPNEVEQATSAIKANADCVRQDMETPEELFKAITREANLAGLSVIAHSFDARHSAEVGVNAIEHLEGVALATIRSPEGLTAVADMQLEEGHKHPLLYQWMEEQYYDEVINTLLEKDVYLNPTLMHEWKGVIDRTAQFEHEDNRLFAHPSLQYIPMDEKLVTQGQYHWADLAMRDVIDEERIFVNNSYFIPAKGLKENLDEGYTSIQTFLRRFVSAGGKLFSGTDTAASSTPGLSLHQEMQLLVDAGISEMDTLASSTRWAAEFLRIDDRLGTVEAGKIADLIILDASPLDDIANTRRISHVIMAGRIVDTEYHADYSFPFHQYGPVSKHLYHRRPAIADVQPGMAIQATETALKITGENFMPETVAVFNGEVVTTTYISKTELAVELDSVQTSQPGSYLISIQTPAPGGGVAEPVEFLVDYKGELD